MRFYIKVFSVAFLCFTIIIGAAFYFATKSDNADPNSEGEGKGILSMFDRKADFTAEDRLSLDRMVKKSNRLNVLMMGTDGGRSDTMMMISYDPDMKLIDIISVPRDTYYEMPGKSPMKLNAVIGLKGELGGPEGTVHEVSKMLGVPIDYYVSVDYKAVKEAVDILGGVEMDIPFKMVYDDPYCKPPLHINIPAGKQLLDGEHAIQFLRWRKNNGGAHGQEGDLGRIERQQLFVKTAIKKALGLKLPLIIPTAVKYVKTDMPVGEMVKQGSSMIGMDMKNTRSYRIPGEAKTIKDASYYLHYPSATEAVMLAIYNRTGDETPVEGTLTKLEEVVDPSKVIIKDSKKTLVEADEEEAPPKDNAVEPEVISDTVVDGIPASEGEQSNVTDEIPADFLEEPTVPDDTSLEDIGVVDPSSQPIISPPAEQVETPIVPIQ